MRGRARRRQRPERVGLAPRPRDRGDDEDRGYVHTLVCPACHAILRGNDWFVDEAQYRQVNGAPGVWPALCPGCLRVARGIYEGEVILRSRLLVPSKLAALDLISHEEERARSVNPVSRLTAVEDHGDEIKVLTTTPLLAERIGKAFRRIYDGDLDVQYLPWNQFCRVRWHRD